MTKCSDHPDAPHGFNRSASHAEGRYVCDCEGWIPDDEEITMSDFTQQQVIDYLMGENGTFSERKSARIAVQRIKQQAETIANLQFHNKGLQTEVNALKAEVSELKSELNCRSNTIIELESGLNSINEYKDKLTAAVLVLVDQCKSGEVSLGAIYDVDILLGE